MAQNTGTNRITSKDVIIQAIPNGAEGIHDQYFQFNSTVSGGTFKLRINGWLSASITFSATAATLVTNIQTALTAAAAALGSPALTASGAAVTSIRVLAASNYFFRIVVEADALTGNSTADPNVTTSITTQGSQTLTISTDITTFSYELSTDMVEVTAIAEYQTKEIPVKESMSFDMSIYAANQDWMHIFSNGAIFCRFYIYDEGKFVGKKYCAFDGWVTDFSKDYPDHEKIEVSLSGSRSGLMVVPFDSVYVG